ncbi:VPLPA-CTERM sorting domain-containing protein [Jannaschia sp. CCS1]|uniref:VPLPA-CTERM sorting domain-containing protein n=1 Tax=Jannaschia sp. (strain CCS1) TaxID=290400 RepID=UPI000053B01D|nr:VPLPA-CTERM sorting domain-containing protein [Jannaschia sp. CCS1]ABD53844.1 hypothetical protein Jann_0927 [Jannaschia sp. CCS1]
MNHSRLASLATCAALLIAPMAQAVTYSNISGVVHENLVPSSAPDAAPGQVLGDWGTDPNRVTLEIVGDTTIYGGLVHANTARNQYLDAWTMDFGTDIYDVSFSWIGSTGGRYTPFDGSFAVNGASTDVGSQGMLTYADLTGRVTFIFNPIHGQSAPREQARWILEARQISPVPLPAGGLLLAGALGAAALARRKHRT